MARGKRITRLSADQERSESALKLLKRFETTEGVQSKESLNSALGRQVMADDFKIVQLKTHAAEDWYTE